MIQERNQVKQFERVLNDETVIPKVLYAVSAYTGMSIDDLIGRKRDWKTSHERQIVMVLAHETNRVSQTYIENYFKRRHGAFDHARSKVYGYYDVDKNFRNKIDKIRDLIKDKNQITHNWELKQTA